jgi:hypothetical protein
VPRVGCGWMGLGCLERGCCGENGTSQGGVKRKGKETGLSREKLVTTRLLATDVCYLRGEGNSSSARGICVPSPSPGGRGASALASWVRLESFRALER